MTLTACVYTAIHLNIPISHRSKWRQLGAKLKWVLVALIGPELVLMSAAKQFRTARHLCKALNRLIDKNKELRQEKVDLSYGFWVVMGGFRVDISDIHDRHSKAVINSKGVEFLSGAGHFLEMAKEDIADRSKADLLTKSLVCIQVVWMLMQCIARKTAGYPLSLLEIHTMVHVVCALCIYILWWNVSCRIIYPSCDVQISLLK